MAFGTHTPACRRVLMHGALLLAATTQLVGCAATSESASYQNQLAFHTPKEAVDSLQLAAVSDDTTTLEAIFGPSGEDVLSSGDPVADANNREVFAVALQDSWSLNRIDDRTRELVVGPEQWPFPIPLVKDKHGWWFDTEAGRLEVLARRIGRNELAAIGVLETYFVAQTEYAAASHDGNPAGIYAQKVRSDDNLHNGLYWEDPSGENPSPLGQFVAAAFAQGYAANKPEGQIPYQGYFFRVLTKQGSAAPGGAMDYVVDGAMTGGFAMVAFPAEYENSGIMTFIIGPDGVVYERDLGKESASQARAMDAYNPGPEWSPVE